MRGYLRGVPAAARYLGMSPKTFRANVRPKIAKPRVIKGQAYYAISALEAFMQPAENSASDSLCFRKPPAGNHSPSVNHPSQQ